MEPYYVRLTITLAVLSPEKHHDQHFVRAVVTRLHAWVKTIAAEGVTFTRHYLRTDGCKGQYKCAAWFLFVSRSQEITGILLIHSFFCSCHGKDLSDPEMGRLKEVGRQHELKSTEERPTTLKSSEAYYEFLKQNHCKLNVDIVKKKFKGIYCRVVWFMTTQDIDRRWPEVKTLDGSSKMHSFEDIGTAGFVRARYKSCHLCAVCKAGDSTKCENTAVTGVPEVYEIHTKSGSTTEVAFTRQALAQEGLELARAAQVGDFVGVEVDSVQEPYMIGQITSTLQVWSGPTDRQFMGTMQAGASPPPDQPAPWLSLLRCIGRGT